MWHQDAYASHVSQFADIHFVRVAVDVLALYVHVPCHVVVVSMCAMLHCHMLLYLCAMCLYVAISTCARRATCVRTRLSQSRSHHLYAELVKNTTPSL